jgi:hypothetical protein
VCTPGPARSPRRNVPAARLGLLSPLVLGALMVAPQAAHAQGYTSRAGHLGFVFETDLEYGGDDAVDVYYTDGSTSKINAGQGVTLLLGAHYRPIGLPVDFMVTAGYKFIGTEDRNSNLGLYRTVFKLTGTYQLPKRFWVDAGPVWHIDTKLKGDGYVPDIPFQNAVGATVGFGWRFIGVSYTYIRYKPEQAQAQDLNASSIGVNLAFKF